MAIVTLSKGKNREARLRRQAKRLGYALERSGGTYRILDSCRIEAIAGGKDRLSLDEAEAWLQSEETKQIEEGAWWVERLRRAGKLK